MEDKLMRSKKTVIIALCAAIFLMAVGFAAFSTTLTIDGTANIASDWKVVFTDIEVISKTDGATSKSADASGTSATFDVGLTSPGDRIVYTVTVENQGTLDAIIENIVAKANANGAIDFEISNIKIGDTLAKKTSTTFNVTISYDTNVTSQPENTTNELKVDITYVQNLGQTITPSEPVIEKVMTLSQAILEDNIAYADNVASLNVTSPTGINFGAVNGTENGNGLYYTSTNTEGNKPVYYFRGNVNNNYVQFGSYKAGATVNGVTYNVDTPIYWRIVRINEDGSVRLIYQGTSVNATGSAATIGSSLFNTTPIIDNTQLGYMYGLTGQTTYENTHSNTYDSVLKTKLDTWYNANFTDYTDMLSIDAGFCNDRTVTSGTGVGTEAGFYSSYSRIFQKNTPQFACPQSRDLFTVTSSSVGNQKLANPVGVLSIDEVTYAGGVFMKNNNSYYLYSNTSMWTISPLGFFPIVTNSNKGSVYHVDSTGSVNNANDNMSLAKGVRPVINLRGNMQITDSNQNGTAGNVYVIKTN